MGPFASPNDTLILLLGVVGRVRGRTRIQKLVFLAQELDQDQTLRGRFAFKPYYYGPFSEELDRELRRMMTEGLVMETSYEGTREGLRLAGYEYELTPLGRQTFVHLAAREPNAVGQLEEVAKRFLNLPLEKLLAWVYKEFPSLSAFASRE